MKRRAKGIQMKRWFYSAQRYLIFFLLMAFVISCCMVLFLNSMTATMGITLGEKGIGQAAKITFANIMLLSLLCTVIDSIRRKYMVERPVKHIIDAADRIMKGDFTARVKPFHNIGMADGFVVIADCFNKMAEELSGTETLRTDFIANVSHELKTPLAIMQNYGTMLQQPDLPEVGRHIFERFYQGDTSHAAQGNGLGLALVKRVADIIGANISIDSLVLEGSTFTVKLRRKKDETV